MEYLKRFRKNAFVFAVVLQLCALILIAESHGKQETWWQTFFSIPGFNNAPNGPEKGLAAVIRNSRASLKCALFELNSPIIIRELVSARRRGIEVCLVMDSDNIGHRGLETIGECGIKIVTDERPGFMHNKFVIIDGKYLWTGSYNATVNGAMTNYNNAILIHSEKLARIFSDEFHEMHDGLVFGNRQEPGPFAEFRRRSHVRMVDGTNIYAYFSPESGIERILVRRLARAKKSIHFLAFSLTSDTIGETIINKHKEGVKVSGVFENRGAHTVHSEFTKMKVEGIAVKIDSTRHTMHHKVLIIDGRTVITGSYNFSKNAEMRNDENVLVIDNKDIAKEYLAEFERIYR